MSFPLLWTVGGSRDEPDVLPADLLSCRWHNIGYNLFCGVVRVSVMGVGRAEVSQNAGTASLPVAQRYRTAPPLPPLQKPDDHIRPILGIAFALILSIAFWLAAAFWFLHR